MSRKGFGVPLFGTQRGQDRRAGPKKGLSLRLALAGIGKDLPQGIFAVVGKSSESSRPWVYRS